MELLKNWISTLCVVVVIVSIAHIILPNASIKKHVKFVFSLIILSVMLSPILGILNFDLENYEKKFSYEEAFKEEKNEENSSFYDNEALLKSVENNLEKALQDEFYENEFKVSLEGEVDFENIEFNINKAKIEVFKDKKVKKVEKIKIGEETEKKEEVNKDSFLVKVEKFVEKELEISNENIIVSYA